MGGYYIAIDRGIDYKSKKKDETMRKFLLMALFFAAWLPAEEPPTAPPTNLPKWQQDVNQIDQEIKVKTNQRNLFLSKAARAQDQGDRLQFQPDNLGDARRYWQLAETYREKANLMDLEINLLQQKRAQILKDNRITNY